MRVTIASETLFPQVNGVSRCLDRLVRHLSERGDTVQLIGPRYSEEWEGDPAGVVRAEFRAVPVPFYREILLPVARNARVRRCLTGFGPQVVHVATEGPLGWQVLRAARRLALPVVSSYHTNFSQYMRYYHLGLIEPPLWRYLRWFHNRGSVTFCPTPSIRELIESKGFENVRVWSRGVDCGTFNPGFADPAVREQYGIESGEIALLYAGRLASEKNLAVLVEAMNALNASRRVKLLLVGDGPFRGHLEQMADERVVFTGYKHGRELSALYASADVFVFPSLTDTFGNVLLEAMASGVPAVGFDAPGPRDVIRDGETGCVVRERSAEALANALGTLVGSPARIRALGTAARTYAEGQTWERINETVREGYAEVIACERA